MRNKLLNSILYVFTFLSLAKIASAAINLNSVFSPFSGINIGAFYLRYFAFIDAIVYLILFLSISKLVFAKAYKEAPRESKMIAVAIGLSLTIAMCVLEMNTGFNLGQLSPIALVMFLVIIAMMLFNTFMGAFDGPNAKGISAALTYLFVYGLLTVPFGSLNRWIETNAPFLAAVLVLAAVASMIYLIIALFEMLGFKSPKPDPATTQPTTKDDRQKNKQEEEQDKSKKDKDPEKSKPEEKKNPEIKILEPPTNKEFRNNDPIGFIFEVKNVQKPFKYVVFAVDSNNNKHNVIGGISNTDKIGRSDVKTAEGPRFQFPGPESYRVYVIIADINGNKILDNNGNELADMTVVNIISGGTPVNSSAQAANTQSQPGGRHYVKIHSPTDSRHHTQGHAVPIMFEARLAGIAADESYDAQLIIKDKNGKIIEDHKEKFKGTHNQWPLPMTEQLPEGEYTLTIIASKNGVKLDGDTVKFTISPKHKTIVDNISALFESKDVDDFKKGPDPTASTADKNFEPRIMLENVQLVARKRNNMPKPEWNKQYKLFIENIGEKYFHWHIKHSANIIVKQVLHPNELRGTLPSNDVIALHFAYTGHNDPVKHDIEILLTSHNGKSITLKVLKHKENLPPRRKTTEEPEPVGMWQLMPDVYFDNKRHTKIGGDDITIHVKNNDYSQHSIDIDNTSTEDVIFSILEFNNELNLETSIASSPYNDIRRTMSGFMIKARTQTKIRFNFKKSSRQEGVIIAFKFISPRNHDHTAAYVFRHKKI